MTRVCSVPDSKYTLYIFIYQIYLYKQHHLHGVVAVIPGVVVATVDVGNTVVMVTAAVVDTEGVVKVVVVGT